MRLERWGVAIALAGSTGLAFGPAVRAQDTFEAVRARVKQIVSEGTVPSMAIAVGRDGRILWGEGFGLADRAERIAATADTPYSVASVTKPFTATALMILHERKQVALDEPITRYVGAMERRGVTTGADVTVRRTLGHLAGFPLHYQFFYDDTSSRPLPFAETMRCYGTQANAPGERYAYSNLGYGVLGEAIARVSGQSYRDFLAREVFAPLGLTQTTVAEARDQTSGAAVRYGNDGQPLPFYVTDHAAASAIYASAHDLVRFGLFHAGSPAAGQRAILTAESLAAMHEPGRGDYGFGWSVNRNWNGHRVLWHSGAMPGSSATLWVVPSHKIALAVVANRFGAPVNQLAGEILAALMAVDTRATAGSSAPARQPVPAAGAAAPPSGPEALALSGRWRGALHTCPDAQSFTLDLRGPHDASVSFGTRAPQPLEGATVTASGVSGTIKDASDGQERTFRFQLRVGDDRLAGPVTRTTSLGARGNNAVTVWADLARDNVPTKQ